MSETAHPGRTTQQQYPWHAVIRTVLQVVISLAAGAPLVYAAIANKQPEEAIGAAAVVLAVAAAITRLMALPFIDDWLSKIGLGSAPKPSTRPMLASASIAISPETLTHDGIEYHANQGILYSGIVPDDETDVTEVCTNPDCEIWDGKPVPGCPGCELPPEE